MKRLLAVSEGHWRLCIEMRFVERVETSVGDAAFCRADTVPGEKDLPEEDSGSAVYSLGWLLDGNENSTRPEQLILLRGNGGGLGLTISGKSEVLDVEAEMVRPLPRIFSPVCRACFPEIVIDENRVIPVVTPDSLVYLEQWKKQGMAVFKEKAMA